MRIIILIIVFVFIDIYVFPQPGGGGGLNIKGLYTKNLVPVKPDDEFLKIEGRYILTEPEYNKYDIFSSKEHFFLKIYPPVIADTLNCYRLKIHHREKEYIFDFQYVLRNHGAGYEDFIDSLVLDRPYVLNKRRKPMRYLTSNCEYYFSQIAKPFLIDGITPTTNTKLNTLGYTFFDSTYIYTLPKWENSFCNAKYALCSNCKDNSESKMFLKQALGNNNNNYNSPIFNLTIEIEFLSENYLKVLNLIEKYPHLEILPSNENMKAVSLIKLSRFDEAIQEFQQLETEYAVDNKRIMELKYIYNKNKVRFYQSKYLTVVDSLEELLKQENITIKYFQNKKYRYDYFEQINQLYFLYSFCLYITKPIPTNLKYLQVAIICDNFWCIDSDFITYLVEEYYMNTYITHEKFQALKVIFSLYKKRKR